MSTFQTALSGLQAASTDLQVMGNNIANANTIGFKSSNAEFADSYAAAIAGSTTLATQIGIGTSVARVAQQFTEGNIQSTNNPMDVAINGQGFYQFNYHGSTVYGRNGQFQLNKQGYIVDGNGAELIGTQAVSGTLTGAAGPLIINTQTLPPTGTTAVTLGLNLNAASTAVASGTTFNPTDPTTYNYSTSTTVYDSLGQSHLLTTYYTLASGGASGAGQSWNVNYVLQGATAAGSSGTASSTFSGSLGTVNFTSAGQITSASSGYAVSGFSWADGATSGIPINMSYTGSTNYSAPNGVSAVSSDGYGAGQMTALSIGADGTIFGQYSNGQTAVLGQITLTNFAAPQGLLRYGNNYFVQTADSGQPMTGTPTAGGLGTLQSSSLEQSNVDLSTQLVALIQAQQTYQANSQTIKAENQVVQTLLSL